MFGLQFRNWNVRHTRDHNPHVQLLNKQQGDRLHSVNARQWHARIMVMDQMDLPVGRLTTLATYAGEKGRPARNWREGRALETLAYAVA